VGGRVSERRTHEMDLVRPQAPQRSEPFRQASGLVVVDRVDPNSFRTSGRSRRVVHRTPSHEVGERSCLGLVQTPFVRIAEGHYPF
jgi:hypothetical protein